MPTFLAPDDDFRFYALVSGPIISLVNSLGLVLYGTIVRMARQARLDRHALQAEKHRLEREIAERTVHLEREIASRMAAERNLREADEALREIVDAMPVGVLVYDRDDRLVLRNRTMQQMYPRRNPEALIGTSRSEGAKALLKVTGQLDGLSPAETVDRVEEWNRLVHLTGHTQVELSLADGRFSRYEAHLLPNGTVVIVHVDISGLKRAQAELEAHVQRLQEAVDSRLAAETDLRMAQTRIQEIVGALPPGAARA
ncbi:MAG: PAS-domain containing protein [Pseudomonadota bacterium]